MKLNTKFVILIGSFALVMLVMSAIMLLSFSMLRELQIFETETVKMQQLLSRLEAYPALALSTRTDTKTIVDEWNELSDKTAEQMHVVTDKSIIKLLTAEEKGYLEAMHKLWILMVPVTNTVNDLLSDFVDLPFTDDEIKNMGISGAQNIVTLIPDSDSRKMLIVYTVNRVNQTVPMMVSTNQTFNDTLSKLSISIGERCDKLFTIFAIFNIAGTVAAAIIAFSLALLATSRITKRVHNLQATTGLLADKDFTVDIAAASFGSDEITALALSLDDTVTNLSDFLENVKQSSRDNVAFGQAISDVAGDTASATNQISASILSLSRQFDDIEESVKRSVSALNRMSLAVTGLVRDNQTQSAAIKESEAASAKMASIVEKIRQMAEENCEGAEDMQDAVSFGDQKIESANAMLRQVSTKVSEVAEVVSIINAIAEQTNILSMNAAIESAHAGESGKGFAVVAEEIRSLAESTGENAKHISESLFAITGSIQDAASSSEHAAQAFSDVTGKSNKIHASLTEILDNINDAAESAELVAAYSQRITAASDKMNAEYDNLNTQRGSVSDEMVQLENVFALSRTGIDEIKIGADDIVERMAGVTKMSSESRIKMNELSEQLSLFKTERKAVFADNATENQAAPLDEPDTIDATESSGDDTFIEAPALDELTGTVQNKDEPENDSVTDTEASTLSEDISQKNATLIEENNQFLKEHANHERPFSLETGSKSDDTQTEETVTQENASALDTESKEEPSADDSPIEDNFDDLFN